jgi:hypothetical protein
VAPTIAPTRKTISDIVVRLSVKPASPPAGPGFAGWLACWREMTTSASSRIPSVSPAQTASIPRRRRSFSPSARIRR